MTTYLLWKGMSFEEVGIWTSIASVTGLVGTFAYQASTRCTSVVATGEIGALYLFACLTVAAASFFIEDERLSTYLFVVACALSRTGLYGFEVVVTLLFQEFVPDGVRGLVGGTQHALNSVSVVLLGILGIFYQRPEKFFVFGAVSCLGACLCALLYTFGVFRRRHLFQMAIDEASRRP